jgi:sulfur dioxygenase
VILFRQLFDAVSSTYTYLLGDPQAQEALLIDPVFEHVRRDTALLRELGLSLRYTLETHVHADHITGAWLLRQCCGSRIAVAAKAGAQGADRLLTHGERVEFGAHYLTARATPGHTGACLTYVLDDQSAAFTGDALLIRGCGRTDFQQGSAATLFRSVREQILSLPESCLLYPGHDYRGLTVTSVGEEMKFNPRLGGNTDANDFAGFMNNLGLPHPKLIDVAVPANLNCGQPADSSALPDEPDWAPLVFTFGGIWEIEPQGLAELLPGVQIIDVREVSEFSDELGHIPGAQLIPLSTLDAHVASLDGARPVVTVCRAGARSAQASVKIRKSGLVRVANLAGGMLRWRAEGFPVEGNRH